MNSLLVGFLGVLIATNQAGAVSNLVTQTTGMVVTVPDPNDPAEMELRKIQADEKAARDEVDGWIQENNAFAEKGAAVPNKELNRRIMKRFEPVRTGYETFIKEHPKYVKARIDYADFLADLGDEEAEEEQLEKARELDPKDPEIWNNLGNIYGHHGPVKKAFQYYEKAIELNPKEPVYYQNLAVTVYLFRKDVHEYYGLTEAQTFDKALDLYAKALSLDPTNFALASDLAQTYYGIKPLRTNDALVAWTNAMNIAHNEVEREGVDIHFARIKMAAGRLAEAQAHLNAVTNSVYDALKDRLTRNLREKEAQATNAPPASEAK